jgi:hypothetical protein
MADTNYVLEAYNNYVIITSHFYLGGNMVKESLLAKYHLTKF